MQNQQPNPAELAQDIQDDRVQRREDIRRWNEAARRGAEYYARIAQEEKMEKMEDIRRWNEATAMAYVNSNDGLVDTISSLCALEREKETVITKKEVDFAQFGKYILIAILFFIIGKLI